MNKNIILGIVIGLIIIVVAGGLLLSGKSPKETIGDSKNYEQTETATGTNTGATTSQVVDAQAVKFTQAEVAQHNTEADCYASINGKVYNLTAWINQHPGGDRAILGLCGTDGSAAFNAQHGKGGRRFETILGGFEVGILVQ